MHKLLLLSATLIALLLSACGQTGALYLPQKNSQQSSTKP
ncbi:lipoprotein [Curvibacter sp. CHRR-16]|nr:lipoprotein [Curvibacter sp. CHRR-16]MBT0569459.1 lipoprotein [Curvibacter sp. CHRR-16]